MAQAAGQNDPRANITVSRLVYIADSREQAIEDLRAAVTFEVGVQAERGFLKMLKANFNLEVPNDERAIDVLVEHGMYVVGTAQEVRRRLEILLRGMWRLRHAAHRRGQGMGDARKARGVDARFHDGGRAALASSRSRRGQRRSLKGIGRERRETPWVSDRFCSLVLHSARAFLSRARKIRRIGGTNSWRRTVTRGCSTWATRAALRMPSASTAETVALRGDPLVLKALVAGQIESFIGGPASSLVAASKGADIKIVGCNWNKQSYVLWGAKDVNSIADLRGKSIGISSPGSAPSIFIRAALDTVGVHADQVNFVAAGVPADWLKSMSAGVISGAATPDEYQIRGEKMGLKVLTTSDKATPLSMQRCYMVSGSTLRDHRDLVVRFLASEMAAYAYSLAHRDETIGLTRKLTSVGPEVAGTRGEFRQRGAAWRDRHELRAADGEAALAARSSCRRKARGQRLGPAGDDRPRPARRREKAAGEQRRTCSRRYLASLKAAGVTSAH